MFETIELHETTSHHEILLNRPNKLNALSSQMVQDLHAALSKLKDAEPKIVVLRGAGKSFCSGHDLSTPVNFTTEEEAITELSKMQEITKMIVEYPAPVIAALHGYALGAGFEIALNCDLIYATESTTLGFPELKVGLSITQGSSYLLPRLVGLYKAKELIFYSKQIKATEAYDLGLINAIYPDEQLLDKVYENISELQERSIGSLAEIKKLFNQGLDNSFESSLQDEIYTLMKLLNEVGDK